MATVAHLFTSSVDYGSAGFQPGQRRWQSWGPSDAYKDSAVVITADPFTQVAGTDIHRAMALQVTDTFVHQYPTVSSGGFVTLDTHVGVWVTNTGQWAIRYVTYRIGVIKA